MLTHLSSGKFINLIADYTSVNKYNFKVKEFSIILFRSKEHLYEKGFRDVYEDLPDLYNDLRTFEVINDMDPSIATAYNFKLPTTLFINKSGKYEAKYGFLSKEEVIKEIEKLNKQL